MLLGDINWYADGDQTGQSWDSIGQWSTVELGEPVEISLEVYLVYHEMIRYEMPPDVYTFYWDLGDGTTSEVSSVTHEYFTPGFYKVTCFVEDKYGRSTSAELWIWVME